MAISFPANPTVGQVYSVNNRSWSWNGYSWRRKPTIGDGVVATQTFVNNAVVDDHGALTGLADDDHTQYLLADGTRSATGLTVNGLVDVSIDKTNFEYFRVVEGSNTPLLTNQHGVGVYTATSNIDPASFTSKASGTNVRPAKFVGVSGQTANLSEWIDGNSAVVASISPAGNIAVSGTVDGRDVAADGSSLDTLTGTTSGGAITRGSGIVTIDIGGTAGTARPANADQVYWICNNGITPTNAAEGDLIYNRAS